MKKINKRKVKDNYKAENLKFYVNTDEEREQLYQRAKELGYEINLIPPETPIVYLRKDGSVVSHSYCEAYLGAFALCEYPQLTVKQFLAPRKGEMVEVRDDEGVWDKEEFYMDLGETSPYGPRYMILDGSCYRHMRPIKTEPQKTELPNKKGFDEAINHLNEAIKLLKG